ncbi:DoxX-like family protein [uncultured Lacinutrix sp.]|uniref:DoxX-like family protein n=1 Tax=uncultured Lacinutrix sp. TaxID=574032 RepID=UPI002623A466|nr:DoxX-like family protein [uncultured Lacinutrix sp.]
MKPKIAYKTINLIIALVWFINGLYCKILNQVPRHQEIVARILNTDYSRTITIMIGLLEICLAIWIIIGYKQKLNALLQMSIVLAMNIIEFILVPDLLLWGELNIIFAISFIILVYLNNFRFNKNNNLRQC